MILLTAAPRSYFGSNYCQTTRKSGKEGTAYREVQLLARNGNAGQARQHVSSSKSSRHRRRKGRKTMSKSQPRVHFPIKTTAVSSHVLAPIETCLCSTDVRLSARAARHIIFCLHRRTASAASSSVGGPEASEFTSSSYVPIKLVRCFGTDFFFQAKRYPHYFQSLMIASRLRRRCLRNDAMDINRPRVYSLPSDVFWLYRPL
jgi:hypothetical protein